MTNETLIQDIAPAIPVAAQLEEIVALGERGKIAQQANLDVYLASADAIPNIMLEIGRLREVTFRAVGEGSGMPRDLDRFDEYYYHLFLWDRDAQQIAGAYRLGRTDLILAEFGFEGLFTSSLCDFEEPLLDYLNPALELGRSWVVPDYQRSIHALLGLWKGIGQFVARYPRYHKLFGAVSISDDYTFLSQNLIVRYLRRTKSDATWGERVRALLPFQDMPEELSSSFQSIDEVSACVASNEPDGKGVPVLLRQYFKMNATLLDFAFDPNFMNCLDAMVLVDLKQAPARLLNKYMGKEGYAKFLKESSQ
ncbi:GNAT family N-acetyltransferase [Akkermansiaceae bacterium]|nr:GNAT family N-acetyltransferase [bacterium]MDA7877881.1 GNAT family N-acetyltransferase [Akkermansiaceae bacterium]MDB4296154.1 GNAT family N-acetyltransferase [bacterium]MDB4374760.1 GNAT family N-acetyltransferase [bacterium]MDB4554711.1 GNAT family N-acetyltransferase [Akkermansiaceae bacterium]